MKSSGWFREFAWENYEQVQAMYNKHYVYWFYKALHEGKIKLYKGEKYDTV